MIERLFVYGTLAPGQSNAHVLAPIRGTWEPATAKGTLIPNGWGAAAGYPGLVLDDAGDTVRGLVFTSPELARHWARLDRFEGEGYRRVVTRATLGDGTVVQAYVYEIMPLDDGPDSPHEPA